MIFACKINRAKKRFKDYTIDISRFANSTTNDGASGWSFEKNGIEINIRALTLHRNDHDDKSRRSSTAVIKTIEE